MSHELLSDIMLLVGGVVVILWSLALNKIYREVIKGNKDQQEIKTRLAWIKKRQYKVTK